MSETPSPAPTPARRFDKARPKVAPFARYEGTSAWRKDRRRVRAYTLFVAAEKAKKASDAGA